MTTNGSETSVLVPAEHELRGGLTPHSAPIEDIGRIARQLREGEVRVSYRMTGLATMGPEVYTLEDVRKRLTGHLSELIVRTSERGKMQVCGRLDSGLPTTAQESFDVHMVLWDPRVVVECGEHQHLGIDPTDEVIEAMREVYCSLRRVPKVSRRFRVSWDERWPGDRRAADELLWFEDSVIGPARDQVAGCGDILFSICAWEIASEQKDGVTVTTETFVVDFMRA